MIPVGEFEMPKEEYKLEKKCEELEGMLFRVLQKLDDAGMSYGIGYDVSPDNYIKEYIWDNEVRDWLATYRKTVIIPELIAPIAREARKLFDEQTPEMQQALIKFVKDYENR